MPYVTCPNCTQATYSAAMVSTRDMCVRCYEPLPMKRQPPETMGFVNAFTKSSSCCVVQHS